MVHTPTIVQTHVLVHHMSFSLPLSSTIKLTLFSCSHGSIVWWRWVWMCLKSDLGSSSSICKHRHLSSSVACRHDQNSLSTRQWYATKNQGITNTLSMFDFTFSFQIFSSLPFFFLMMRASLILKLCHLFSPNSFSLLSLIRIHFGSCFCWDRSASV